MSLADFGTDKQPPPRHSFQTLNGLRGFAAIAVLLLHFDWQGRGNFWHANLSVDLFFLLSGFVIAHSYENKLRTNLSFWKFITIRAIRFWPLYLLGTAIGLAASLYGIFWTEQYWQIKRLIFYAVWSITLFPQFFHFDRYAFPLNLVAWSLSLELLINIAYGLSGFRMSNRALAVVAALGLAWLTINAFVLPPMGVWEADGIWILGLPRVVFSFPLGVLLHRLWQQGDLPRVRVPAWAIVGGFIALLFAAALGDPRISDLLVVAIGWPIVLILGVTNEPGPIGHRVFAFLVDISYPLYATHIGFYMFAVANVDKVDHDVAFVSAAVGAFTCSIFLDRYYDRPVRRWLTRVTNTRASRANVAAPL